MGGLKDSLLITGEDGCFSSFSGPRAGGPRCGSCGKDEDTLTQNGITQDDEEEEDDRMNGTALTFLGWRFCGGD